MNDNSFKKEQNKDIESNNDNVTEDENVTREINLDDLYDGSINSTIIMDPLTNKEVLIKNKKPNYTIIGIILAVLILLGLYYINNKTDLLTDAGKVEPKKTTTISTKKVIEENGKLVCNYSLQGDSESQTITFNANYQNGKIIDSEFNFIGISNSESLSANISDLINQYETFYINNASIKGNEVTFDKDSKGFTFNIKTNYSQADFAGLVKEENKNVLYVLPNKEDTYESLNKAYSDKGFTCNLEK